MTARRLLLSLGLLALAACGRADLYSGLSESHANEMIVALDAAGVTAAKTREKGGEGAWSVSVAPADFAFATRVLDAADLPREEHDTIGDLFRKKGFVSTETAERARYTYAVAQELSRTLSAIDGVQVARVHIVHPERDPIAREVVPASASVLLKHEAGVSFGEDMADIKMIVAHAVQGLDYDDVKVALFEARPAPVRQTPPVQQAAAVYAVPAMGAGGLALLALIGLRRRRPPVQGELPAPAASDTSEAGRDG